MIKRHRHGQNDRFSFDIAWNLVDSAAQHHA